MSTKITRPEQLPPVSAGDDCSVCWGLNKSFSDGDTPESVTAIVEGIEKGPGWSAGDGEPPNGTFVCEQVAGFPCFFDSDLTGSFGVKIRWHVSETVITVFNDESRPAFNSGGGSICSTVRFNTQTFLFKNGTIVIRIPGVI